MTWTLTEDNGNGKQKKGRDGSDTVKEDLVGLNSELDVEGRVSDDCPLEECGFQSFPLFSFPAQPMCVCDLRTVPSQPWDREHIAPFPSQPGCPYSPSVHMIKELLFFFNKNENCDRQTGQLL